MALVYLTKSKYKQIHTHTYTKKAPIAKCIHDVCLFITFIKYLFICMRVKIKVMLCYLRKKKQTANK